MVLRTRALVLVLLGGAIVAAAAQLSPAPPTDVPVLRLSSDLRIAVRRGRDVELEVLAREAADVAAIARRVCDDASVADAVAAWNGTAAPVEGSWVRVPLRLLSSRYRRLVLTNLLPRDQATAEGDWVHVARTATLPLYDVGLWQIAEWYTAGGGTLGELMQANALDSPELRAGQSVRIPAGLLHPAFAPRPRSDDLALEFDSDDAGAFAAYRLRAGEALYSAVVMRFTGRVASADVGELAQLLAERNGIADPRDIPIGLEIRIPTELVEPEFLPRDHPRRLELETERASVAREMARQPVRATDDLKGVLVILDPGHGGRDLGTMNHGIWEHDYVYDVACRLRAKLLERTAARVEMTLEDLEHGFDLPPGDTLAANRQGSIRTTPAFLATENGEAGVAVHLRWYLANSIHRRALGEGIGADRVVFLSLHADSRHPALRGVMVYVPGAAWLGAAHGFTTPPYDRFREVREQPIVRFTKKQLVHSEASSRRLAEALVEGFVRHDLPIQPYQPVRGRILRGRERFVPAVLRGNVVPTKVLVEMLNLGNAEDAALLGSARERDRLAEALLDGLTRHFGGTSNVARKARAAAP